MCNSYMPKKEVISARLTDGGYRVFKRIKDNLPKGVEKIDMPDTPDDGPYWSCKTSLK